MFSLDIFHTLSSTTASPNPANARTSSARSFTRRGSFADQGNCRFTR